VELWYEVTLQILYGASTITLLLWLCQKTTHGFLLFFSWLSWVEALWLIIMALSREEWRLLYLAAGGIIKALLLPYLSRRWPDPEPAQQKTISTSLTVLIFVGLAVFCMFLGHTAGPLYRLDSEALSVVFLICLSALSSTAIRATTRLQLLSLAILEGGLVLLGVHINSQIPMGWIFASIILLVVLLWRLSYMRVDEITVEA
jgi:hypothetical protein